MRTVLRVVLLVAFATAVLAAGEAGAQRPADDDWQHTIEPGDTLIGLRDRLMRPDVNCRVVQRLNRVADPRRLMPGRTLRIPAALLREEEVSAEVLHVHGEVWLQRAAAPRVALAAVAPLPGASYQVQIARDAAFADLVLDERTERTEVLLAKPDPGTYQVRERTIGADGRAGAFGAPQVIEVPRSWWWLWLLPLLLLF